MIISRWKMIMICQILTSFQTLVYIVSSKYSLLSKFAIFVKKIKYSLLDLNVFCTRAMFLVSWAFSALSNYFTFQCINEQLP